MEDTLKIDLEFKKKEDSAYCGVKVFSDSTFAVDEGDEAAAWFNTFLSKKHPVEHAKLGPLRFTRDFSVIHNLD